MNKLLSLLENLSLGIIKIFIYSLLLFWIIGLTMSLFYIHGEF